MTMKPCPQCKRLIPYGAAYCKDCAPIAVAHLQAMKDENAKKLAAKYNRRRDPKYVAFYRSKAWKTLSRTFMQSAHYKCQAKLSGCQKIATDVHHKEPIQKPTGWERRLDWDNLEATCGACHNRRHPEKLGGDKTGAIDLRTVER